MNVPTPSRMVGLLFASLLVGCVNDDAGVAQSVPSAPSCPALPRR